jgi:hypothetical protein
MCKGLDYWIDGRIKAEMDVRPARLKRKPGRSDALDLMQGFIGEFHTNFILPDFIGLGKQVAKGFGTVRIS